MTIRKHSNVKLGQNRTTVPKQRVNEKLNNRKLIQHRMFRIQRKKVRGK